MCNKPPKKGLGGSGEAAAAGKSKQRISFLGAKTLSLVTGQPVLAALSDNIEVPYLYLKFDYIQTDFIS